MAIVLLLYYFVLASCDGDFKRIEQIRSETFINSSSRLNYTIKVPLDVPQTALIHFTFIERQNQDQSISHSSFPICIVTTKPYVSFNQLQMAQSRSEIKTQNVSSNYLNFDYQSSLSNSNSHMVQFEWDTHETLYFLAGDYQSSNTQFRVAIDIYMKEYKREDIGCTNNCQSRLVGLQRSPFRTCSENQCFCGYRYYGSYCQFEKETISLNSPVSLLIRQQKWQVMSFNLDTIVVQNVIFKVENLKYDILLSFGFNGIVGQDVPSLISNQYGLPQTTTKSVYAFESYITQYKKQLEGLQKTVNQEIYIGFFNPTDQVIQFSIVFTTSSQNDFLDFLVHNYILMIFLAVNCFLSLFFMLFNRHRTRNAQFHDLPSNNPQLAQTRIVRRRKVVRGFRKEFIETYFLPYMFIDLLNTYPLLREQEECVICLEPMKLLQDEIEMMCSVTPCFHMYHHDCLKKWFLCQKYCPICRTKFTEIQIRKSKQWVNILSSQQQTPCASTVRPNQNPYIQRIKKSKLKAIDESEIQLQNSQDMMLDQSVQDPNSISMVMAHHDEQQMEEEKKQPENILEGVEQTE